MYMPFSDDKHRFVRDNFFFLTNFVSDWILSRILSGIAAVVFLMQSFNYSLSSYRMRDVDTTHVGD